jgi:DNA-binding NarL/FixJ family response regulator
VSASSNADRTSGGVATDRDGEPAPPRVALVDPHLLLSHALVEVLNDSGMTTDAVWGGSADDIISEIETAQPDVALLEYEIPAPPGPPEELIRSMTTLGTRVVMLTACSDDRALGACLQAGAIGIIDKKRASFNDFVAAIRAAAENDGRLSWQSQTLLAQLRRSRAEEQRLRAPFEFLTPREGEVLGLLCQGLGAGEIADHAYVSLPTVRSHIRSILLKLGVRSQLAAAAKAYGAGWYQA